MENTSRRSFLATTGKATLALAVMNAVGCAAAKTGTKNFGAFATPFTQTPLDYRYTALEPYIDAQTMEIHYTKHAAGYAKALGEAVKAETTDANITLENILGNISKYTIKMRNNAGGHYNHELFWKTLKVNKGGTPDGALATAINANFGSFENFKTQFTEAAKTRFGSGWAWLVLKKDGKLEVTSTANQDNPLMNVADVQGIPLLGLDVWEHAYYLKYQNKRPDYVTNFWNVINWNWIGKRYEGLM